METRFKERVSNVISWAGFLCLVAGSIVGFLAFFTGDILLVDFAIFPVGGWIVGGVVNYLLCDDLRLLPWEEKEGS
jgi:hypothetical protein